MFGAIGANSLPADAPVSIPHIWGLEYTGWLQWGANTNSVMERNIGQALGVGALFDPKTFESTVRLENLHQLEELAYKITPPTWPDSFPPIDTARAERGRALFYQTLRRLPRDIQDRRAHAHLPALLARRSRHRSDDGDQLRAAGHACRRHGTAVSGSRPRPDYANQAEGLQELNLDAQTIAQWEQRETRTGPQMDPTFRAPLLDSEKWDDTRGRKIYRAKTLVGIWATAPFLHNGSVPTLYDLLRPAAERPVTFPTGQREYDPVKLGIQTDRSKYRAAAGSSRIPDGHAAPRELEYGPRVVVLSDVDR